MENKNCICLKTHEGECESNRISPKEECNHIFNRMAGFESSGEVKCVKCAQYFPSQKEELDLGSKMFEAMGIKTIDVTPKQEKPIKTKRTCLNYQCPERKGGECNAKVDNFAWDFISPKMAFVPEKTMIHGSSLHAFGGILAPEKEEWKNQAEQFIFDAINLRKTEDEPELIKKHNDFIANLLEKERESQKVKGELNRLKVQIAAEARTAVLEEIVGMVEGMKKKEAVPLDRLEIELRSLENTPKDVRKFVTICADTRQNVVLDDLITKLKNEGKH